MLSSVTINCQVTKIVMDSGSQLSDTVFKFISKHLIINWFSTRNHPDSWLPWINPTRTTDRADLQKSSSKRGGRKWKINHLNINKTGTMGPCALTAIDTAALELTLRVRLEWCREI